MPWKVPTQSGAAGSAQHGLDAPTHLARRLVGEGDREDAVRRDVLDLHQPRDAMRQHTGLAAAGAGQHQRRLERSRDCLALGIIQGVKQWR